MTAGETAAEVAGEATGPEPAAAEPESADLPLWDWSPPAAEEHARTPEEPPAERADPPKPEWKPVVTPVEEAGIRGRRHRPAPGQPEPPDRQPEDAGLAAAGIVAVVVRVVFSIMVPGGSG